MKKAFLCFLAIIIAMTRPLPALAAVGQTIEQLADSAKLRPISTGCAELDMEIQTVLDSVIEQDMSRYQKLRAVYDYCVTSFAYSGRDLTAVCANGTLGCHAKGKHTTCEYQILIVDYTQVQALEIDGVSTLTRQGTYDALMVLQSNHGVCNNYAAAFVALANAIGFEAHYMDGHIQWNSGQWYGHAWALVKLGDSYYIFDPQAEQFNMRDGKIQYMNFGINSEKYSPRENALRESIERREACLERAG